MPKLPIWLLAALIVLAAGAEARAQCAAPRVSKARTFKTDLVQAFVACGAGPCGIPGNIPTTATEDGIDACPPETPNAAYAADPATGWLFGPAGRGSIQLKGLRKPANRAKDTSLPPASAGGLNPIGDTVDFAIVLTLTDVRHTYGLEQASGTGYLTVFARLTIDDRVSGDMTMIDLPVIIPFSLVDGKTKVKSSIDAFLNFNGLHGLPPCASVTISDLSVLDVNGHVFAVPGLQLD